MTQEEKRILLIDLCSRLPYDNTMIRVEVLDENHSIIKGGTQDDELCTMWVGIVAADNPYHIIKPYLRPIKSMTEDECNKLFKILNIDEANGDWLKINDIGVIRLFTELGKDFYEIADAMDYLYSIHVDFRNMIEKGLAIEALDGMYKTE